MANVRSRSGAFAQPKQPGDKADQRKDQPDSSEDREQGAEEHQARNKDEGDADDAPNDRQGRSEALSPSFRAGVNGISFTIEEDSF